MPRAVFFGSGGFALPSLDRLAGSADLRLAAVVTAPSRPAGRAAALAPTPVATRARELGLAVLAPPRLRDPAVVEALTEIAAEVGVLADYGKILPQAILDGFPHGVLNLHPSLLPRHRGAAPIPATIEAGDAETGVTLFRMDAGMDTGPVIAVERAALSGLETAPELEARLAAVAADLVERSLGRWLRGELVAIPQAEDGATVTRPLRREDGQLEAALPARILERRVRALRPWPGTYLETAAGRVVVLRASAVPGEVGEEPGRLAGDGDGLALTTADGRLRLLEVKPAGRTPMNGAAFRRGRPGLVGSRVG